MISLEEFKDALGDEAKKLSEEQILKVREQMDQMAGILFDMWLKERNKKIMKVDYNLSKSEHSEEKVNEAFDILFEETKKAGH